MASILKISEAASLAMHTLAFMAQNKDQSFTVKQIAGQLNGSEFHLSKVLQRLARSGFLNSTRGPKGGFSLTGDWKNTTLLEVYELMEGPLDMNPCITGNMGCGINICILGGLMNSVNEQFKKYMGNVTLNDFRKTEDPS